MHYVVTDVDCRCYESRVAEEPIREIASPLIFHWRSKTELAHNVLWEKATVPTFRMKSCRAAEFA